MKTQQSQYVESVPLAKQGQFEAAARIIELAKEKLYQEKDKVLYYLDLGMLYHWLGNYESSNEMLAKAENAIEELFTKSISKALASGVLNDNALDYSGEDYEDIYLNIFKALNYIGMGDTESALVEVRRVQIKLNILEDKYKRLVDQYNASAEAEGTLEYRENRFYNDVLARYISLLLYRAQGDWDDTRIDREKIDSAWKDQKHLYYFPKPELPHAGPPDEVSALVNVISFSGLSPMKLADTVYGQSGPNIVFLTMVDQNEDYITSNLGFSFLIVPGLASGVHFKVQFPRMVSRRSEADRVLVKLDGRVVAELPMLESMETIARETFLLKQPLTVGKTIIRAAIKNIAKEAGKDAMQQGLSGSGFGGLVAGLLAGLAMDIAVDATENADLRISQFFPSDARAGEFLVSPGTYHVEVEYWNGSQLMSVSDHGNRTFGVGGLNLIESYMLR